MKSILIDPMHQRIEFTTRTPADRALFPGGICLGARYPNGDALYVDDEGLLRPATAAFRPRTGRLDGQPLMGYGLLVGPETPRGRPTPVRTTLAQAQEEFAFLTREEALQWFRARASGAAISINGQMLSSWGDMLKHLDPAVPQEGASPPAIMSPAFGRHTWKDNTR